MEEYEYGQPIPEKYRNRLFVWAGGGYDGCFWEPNAGLVDEEGVWHPIYSTGRDGIDDHEWYDRKIFDLKNELGYDVRPPKVQYDEKVWNAVKKVFGEDWYKLENVDCEKDPRVVEMTKNDKHLYDEYVFRKRKYEDELARRESMMFMSAFDREFKDDRPEEVGLLDDEHAKETCRKFCEMYEDNVGFMAYVLDGIEKRGYEAWCTCSDCGEQFQSTLDSFSAYIDGDAYTGNGGIGVIMKRILCDDCVETTRCPCCTDYSLPNIHAKDGGGGDFKNYDLFASVILDWLGVCWGCADGFFREYAEWWNEERRMWMNTDLGDRFEEIHEKAKNMFGAEGHELYKLMENTLEGRKMINKIRDLFEGRVSDYVQFKDDLGCEDFWMGARLSEYDPKQLELTGIAEEKEDCK